jgi:radical SAM enzyme (TIGR01210 family)
VNINGQPGQRLMIVLRTRGCEYAAKNDGGCTVCGFANHAVADITDLDILDQLDYILDDLCLDGVDEIDLLTLGSFLNENEISARARRELLGMIAQLSGVRRVSFESRSEYVTEAKLAESRRILGDRVVEFGIGLESADDQVRNQIIRKGLTRQRFERVARTVGLSGLDLLVYLLIKPPHLTEQQAIGDAEASVAYVSQVAANNGVRVRMALEPVFVAPNTYLEQVFLRGEYRLVNLWSVVEVILRTHRMGNLFVGLSDEDLSRNRTASSCPLCHGRLIQEIERFNRTLDASRLRELDCRCRSGYLADRESGRI